MAKIILGVVVVLGAGYFIFFQNSTDSSVPTEEMNSEVSEDSSFDEEMPKEEFEESTTLTALMKKGGNYMCTFTHSLDMGTSTGTVYINGKNIRGDFVSKVSVQGFGAMGDFETHMISDGELVHSWSSMTSEGVTSPVHETPSQEQESYNLPTDQKLDYSCAPWSVDASKFLLPTNITFKAVSY